MADTDALQAQASVELAESAPHLSVVVTVLNEAGNLEELYRRTIEALEPTAPTFELVFVDDGSTDATGRRSPGCTSATTVFGPSVSGATSASTPPCTPGSPAPAARSS